MAADEFDWIVARHSYTAMPTSASGSFRDLSLLVHQVGPEPKKGQPDERTFAWEVVETMVWLSRNPPSSSGWVVGNGPALDYHTAIAECEAFAREYEGVPA